MKRSTLLSGLLCVVVSSGVAAQACSFGPGEMFGVVAYQCANCGFKREKPDRATYLFYAEPVVLEAKSPGVFRVGDVVEAVDGKPITTSAGAESFTYPAIGDHEISVRRGRLRQTLRLSVSGSACDVTSTPGSTTGYRFSLDDIEAVEVLKGAAAAAQYGPSAASSGVVVITTKRPGSAAVAGANRDTVRSRVREILGAPGPIGRGQPEPLFIVDGVPISAPDARAMGVPFVDRTGRFGFAVECKPSCTAATTKEGPLHYTYYKYDGFPPVAAIRAGSAAERAGLKVGDLVTKVDGHPIGEEEGARILAKLDRQDKLSLTVRRGDKDLVIVIEP